MILLDHVHLVSTLDDDDVELHVFAQKVGLHRHWFQGEGHKFHHYNITTERRRRIALAKGATLVTTRELIQQIRSKIIPNDNNNFP